MSTLVTTALRHNASTSNNMVLDSSGRVGIGTTPSDNLTVSSSMGIRNSNFAGINYFGSSVNGAGVYTGLDSAGGFAINVRDSGYQTFSTNNTERMRIDSSGQVGIGTSNPIRRLTLAQNGTPEFVIQDTSQGTDLKNWRIYNVAQNLIFGTLNDAANAGTNVMLLERNGRVTKPLQPMFYARGAELNYTLTNGADIPFNNAVFNIGSHYNASTFRFTAPVAGYYFIAFHLFVQSVSQRVSIKVNNTAYHNNQMNVNAGTNSWAGVMSLNANDFVSVGDWQNSSGATFYMGHSTFSGYLLG